MTRRKLSGNKFNNLSREDWKEANEISTNNRGVNGLTREEVFRKKELLRDFIGSCSAEGLSLSEVYMESKKESTDE
ncbi:hypothetical protein 278BB001_251 [Bacillus phage 278BB001]|nr:hypothetical protein 278BB001_251 [Bacillus phage 278BB001]